MLRDPSEQGGALLEVCLGMLVFILLVFGLIDFSHVISVRASLIEAAQMAQLMASTDPEIGLDIRGRTSSDPLVQKHINARRRVVNAALNFASRTFSHRSNSPGRATLIEWQMSLATDPSVNFALSSNDGPLDAVLLLPGESATSADGSITIRNESEYVGSASSSSESSQSGGSGSGGISVVNEGTQIVSNFAFGTMSLSLTEEPLLVELTANVKTTLFGGIRVTGRGVGMYEVASPASYPDVLPLPQVYATYTAIPTSTPTPVGNPPAQATSTPTPLVPCVSTQAERDAACQANFNPNSCSLANICVVCSQGVAGSCDGCMVPCGHG